MRSITLCADDYGISRGVSRAIRDLLASGRINATSVMVVPAAFDSAEVEALAAIRGSNDKRPALGLHVTLTAPFKPLTGAFPHLDEGRFCSLRDLMRRGLGRRLETAPVAAEIAAQIDAFVKAFGRPPDFVDGHQHVQLFPQLRDAFLRTVIERAPNAWVRQCGRPAFGRPLSDRKALLLDILSVAFRRKARRYGLRFNPSFAGSYDFLPDADFSKLFPVFLRGLPDGGLVMCHPGFVDAELERLDSLTTLREREYAYFKSDQFMQSLAEKNVALA
jgi:chitin disaccharide deacetylase